MLRNNQTDDQMWAAIASYDDAVEWQLEPPDTTKEDRRERDWTYLEGEAREFVQKYGIAAMLRCVSDACK